MKSRNDIASLLLQAEAISPQSMPSSSKPMRAAPQLTQRYRVETTRNADDDPSLAGRVMGYLSRLHRNITPSPQSR